MNGAYKECSEKNHIRFWAIPAATVTYLQYIYMAIVIYIYTFKRVYLRHCILHGVQKIFVRNVRPKKRARFLGAVFNRFYIEYSGILNSEPSYFSEGASRICMCISTGLSRGGKMFACMFSCAHMCLALVSSSAHMCLKKQKTFLEFYMPYIRFVYLGSDRLVTDSWKEEGLAGIL